MLTMVLSRIDMKEPIVVTLRASQRGSMFPKRLDNIVALIASPTPLPRWDAAPSPRHSPRDQTALGRSLSPHDRHRAPQERDLNHESVFSQRRSPAQSPLPGGARTVARSCKAASSLARSATGNGPSRVS